MAELDAESRSIFLWLVDRPQDEWPAALAAACADRPDVRAKVERLLTDHLILGSILPENERARTETAISDVEAPGTVVGGNYKLLEQLGEGGFGVVYLAEQTAPVRRKVAIKILKPGMDTGQVVARFEAERQALAIMDHPNIARVFDGGVTAAGRPFFAMEFVKGVPITEFCDQQRFTPQQRLELFVDVCKAVQHAHQKGIIHRDIKPSNVLVSRHDTRPVVKVIDFGVAKALGQELTDKTLFTNVAQMIGTPLYMSPEQAGMSDLDVDTRSDIYSLGVLLYELLTGATPFSKERFKKAAYDEIRRIIREEDPPKPSTRISESTETLPSVAANRGVEPRRLGALMRGELDWIVMKALEKDRNRRYETANGFAADVQRYLAGEAVLAVPPSAGYRVRKYVRRHRAFLTTACTILVLSVAGVAVSTWQARRAIHAEGVALAAKWDADQQKEKAERYAERETEHRKKAEAKEAEAKAVLKFFEQYVFTALRPKGVDGGRGHDVSLMEAVLSSIPALSTGFENFPLVEAQLRLTLGMTLTYAGKHSQAAAELERARELFSRHLDPDHPDVLGSMTNLAMNYEYLNRHREALKLSEDVVAGLKRSLPPDHPRLLDGQHNLASSYEAVNRHEDAFKLREEVLAARRRVLPPDHTDTLRIMSNLANSYEFMNREDDALQLRERVLEARRRIHPPDHVDLLRSMNDLGVTYVRLNRNEDAARIFAEILGRRDALSQDHPSTLLTKLNLGIAYMKLNRNEDAVPLLKAASEGFKRAYDIDHPRAHASAFSLGKCLAAVKRHEEAIPAFREALAAQLRTLPKDGRETMTTMFYLANSLDALNRHADGIKLREDILATTTRLLPKDSPEVLLHQYLLANSLEATNRHGEALKLREENLAARKRVLPPNDPDIFRSMISLANSYHATGRVDKAIKLREETRDAMTLVLPADNPDLLRCLFNLAWGYWSKNRFADSLRVTDEFLAKADPRRFDPNLISQATIGRLQCCLKLGDAAGCRKSAEMFESLGRTDATSLYNAACHRSLTAALEAKSSDPTVSRLAKEDADKAMTWLQKAVAAGWTDVAHIGKDSDLDFIRNRDDFTKLIAELEAKAPSKKKDAPPPQKGK